MAGRLLARVRDNVVAYVALFVALSGTAVAAGIRLAPNSVGTSQLKNGAVTGAKVARHTLTPANLDLPPGAISGGGADVMGGTSFFLSPNQCQPCAIPPLGLSPGPLGNVQAAVSTSAARGTASQLSVTVTSPPGSGSGWQFMLVDYLSQRILLSCSIVNSNATCTDTTDHASFAAGALLYFLASAHGQPQPALAKFGWRESP